MDCRADRMRDLIIDTFWNCLEKEDFSTLTVGRIADAARINRSTFYRYFEDKYHLRDLLANEIVSDYVANMEVDFLDSDIRQDSKHSAILKSSLEHIYTKKRELEILWQQKLLGRNVFEEMIEGGARKLEREILHNSHISAEKKRYADWYAKLLTNNMLVTIRWWFTHEEISSAQITDMMKQHMMMGTIPTLKAPL